MKTIFRAISPVTGREYTRSSAHAYTHAVITTLDTAGVVARAETDLADAVRSAAKYREVVRHLADGTTPEPGSVLLGRASARSANMERAGVRTEWDAVQFDLTHPLSVYRDVPRETLLLRYAEYQEHYEMRARKTQKAIEAARNDNRVDEGATFHHSAKLANNAAKKAANGWRSLVVPAESR